MTSLEALGALIDAGKLPRLEIINLFACAQLRALPAAFGRLRALKEVYIMRCHGLRTLPASLADLPNGCMVNVWECEGLTSLPDLSGRPDLVVEAVPERLRGWEEGGRKEYGLLVEA